MNQQTITLKKHQHHGEILGNEISAINYQTAEQEISSWIEKGQESVVCVAAAHLVMEAFHSQQLRQNLNQAAMVTPDGMPLVWLLRFLGFKNVERVYGPALTIRLCKLAAKNGWRVFFLGGLPGQSQQMGQKLQKKFPKLKVVGGIDTPIRPIPEQENLRVIGEINKSQADLVFVGLGCPFQENWMFANRNKLKPAVLIGVGAAFDFITGRVAQAPNWMQRIGLEWLFRLLQNPRKLWKRYLVYNSQFVILVFWAILKNRLKS